MSVSPWAACHDVFSAHHDVASYDRNDIVHGPVCGMRVAAVPPASPLASLAYSVLQEVSSAKRPGWSRRVSGHSVCPRVCLQVPASPTPGTFTEAHYRDMSVFLCFLATRSPARIMVFCAENGAAEEKWLFSRGMDMQATIDAAGRLILPAEILQQAGFRPGMSLKVRWLDNRLEIEPASLPIKLVRQGHLLVAVAQQEIEPLSAETVEQTSKTLWQERSPHM